MVPRESLIRFGETSLYAREVGGGQAIIVLHGGGHDFNLCGPPA
jgi:hypothetical protein